MNHHREPPRWLTFSRGCAGYGGYALGGIVFVLCLLPFSLILGLAPRLRGPVFRTAFRLGCAFLTRAYLPLLRIYRIAEITGYRRTKPLQPAVYVANHRGRLDGPLLLGIIHSTGVLMKSRYARQPVYSSFVRHLDFVSVNPSSLESLAGAMKRCTGILAEGRSLLVFPEGSRASSARLLPFRDFAFRVAMTARVPVIPVCIHSDLPFMAKIKGSHFPRRIFTYRVHFLDPLHAGLKENAADFANRARTVLARHCAGLDAGTYWESTPERND